MKKVALGLALSFLALTMQAQNVNGRVKSASDGSPIIGASILERGTNNGAITDLDGNFSIQLTALPATLEISYIGFTTQAVVVETAQQGLEITLEEGAVLDEVVVTALGMTREKKALAYSIQQIKGEMVQEVRTTNLGNALTGKIAGVNVAPPSTGAAGSSRVIIRGGSSLGGNDQPLYVVNGVPIETNNYGQAGLWGGNDGGDGLAAINPDDIENISVLKGNTAAALYGARAANGVILITTKSGAARKGIGVQFNSNLTMDRVIDMTDFQTEYGQGVQGKKFASQDEALSNGSNAWGAKYDGSNTIQFDGVSRPYSYLGEEINEFYRTASTLNNSLAFSGGNETGTYRLAVSDLRNQDIMPNANFNRQTVALNVNSKLKKVSVNVSVNYAYQDAQNRPRLSDSPGNANFSVVTKPREIPYDVIAGPGEKQGAKEDLTELRFQGNTFSTNPYWAAYQFYRRDISNRLFGNVSARYDLTSWLYVMGRVGTDFTNRDQASTEAYGTAYKPLGDYNESYINRREDNMEIMVGGEKRFNDFSVDYLVGGNRMRNTNKQKGTGGNDLVVPFFHSVNNVKAPGRIFDFSQIGINSIYGSANFGYKNWLYLNVTGRQDQFSTLSAENNSLFYPSAGVSAVLSDAFKLPAAINFAKIRASWAQVGGGGPNPYALNVQYGLLSAPHGSANAGQITTGSIPNPDLSPYTSSELEFGADLRLFQNRLGIDFAIYSRTTTNDILNAGISAISGFGSTQINVGELTNKGFELMLNVAAVNKKNFNWDVTINMANNVSEAVNLGLDAKGQPIQFLNYNESRVRQGERVRHIVGEQLGAIVGWTHATDASGNKIYTEDGMPVRSADANSILGYGRQPFSGGLINAFSYKNFTLSFLIDLRSGGSIFSGTNWLAYRWGLHQETLEGRSGGLKVQGVTATGTPVNVTVPVERLSDYWARYSDITEYLVYDASFAKLRELAIGFKLPKTALKNLPIESLSIQLVGRNLAMLWSNVPNIDPESAYSSSGADQGLEFFAMPLTRNVGINLSVGF
ncbi:MAG: SusC/RagA family TonB-linked outer membrane protein [Haliscomenobacter sp.]|nr:SusC/RagA family TonB-linked outer membrane protein [Haliscomenobacter sp.]MBP9076259.1 SusC/RagA family TonB-linked outer membrane protein [Haliscomenobacter sp.]MBP9872577.1 SusC/RagA family TonB-linked outer membrane protein [Haliscomenobacter sp.]